jgi:hypothetical protein
VFDQTKSKKDTDRGQTTFLRAKQGNPLHAKEEANSVPEQGKKLLEETKERVRLELEARTRVRLEQLEQQDFESCAILGERLKELTPEQSRQLLEETRSRVKTEELEFESSAELGDKILNEFWDLWDLQKELEDLAKL